MTTPEGFPNKAKGCAYPRNPGEQAKRMFNPEGVAYSPVCVVSNGQPFQD